MMRRMPLQQPRLVTADEVAERLRVDRSTVTRWAATGRLPVALKMPGKRGARLFNEADVDRLAAELKA